MASNSTESNGLSSTLKDMGFEEKRIETCLKVLSNTSGGFELSLEAAVEWLLTDRDKVKHQDKSTSDGSSRPPPLVVSRLHMSEQQEKDKKSYEAKERQAALRKNKEKKLADLKAREMIKRQIADDRAAQEARHKPTDSKGGTKRAVVTSIAGSDSCLIQVRLPNGSTMRQSFQSGSTLRDVLAYVTSQCPGQISLVQPFPRKEFSNSEYRQTLKSLGLCPSASLVAVKEKVVHQPHGTKGEASTSKDAMEHSIASHIDSDDGVVGGSSMECSPTHKGNDDDDDDDDDKQYDMDTREHEEENQEVDMQHPPMPPPMPPPFMPPRRRIRHMRFRDNDMMHDDEEVEDYGGHRLGGRNIAAHDEAVPGENVIQENVADAVRVAALRRATKPPSTIPSSPTGLHLQVSRLDDLCVKLLVRRSRDYGLPNCTGLSSAVAESLITALANNKMLKPKTLGAFSKCILYKIKLDGYIYMTNELLMALRVHPSLTCLSCRSSPVITDKGIASLIPCLKQLEYLNLNFCQQLTGNICNYIRYCRHLEVLQLSGLEKLNDESIEMLLSDPLGCLTELDISHTAITDRSLEAIAKGTPNLQLLNCEYTKLKTLHHVGKLTQLRDLNISKCANVRDITELQKCSSLQCLNLSGLKLSHCAFCALEVLHLSALRLPDRNCFMDESMSVLEGFPLQALDLSDYCHITDHGITHINAMHTLTVLLLSRTKLTDSGMPFIAGLKNLQELSLDNTAITDEGVKHISELRNLAYLSLSDTKVTSAFLIEGVINRLDNLSKLNLSRTNVDDEGAFSIRSMYLSMLNLEWTLCTNVCTIEEMRNRGCPMLDTLRVSNKTQKTQND